jgi:hypothetical protein
MTESGTASQEPIKFRRVKAGHYLDKATGFEIVRANYGASKFSRCDWYVQHPNGEVLRVEATFAEAEMYAHKFIEKHGRA